MFSCRNLHKGLQFPFRIDKNINKKKILSKYKPSTIRKGTTGEYVTSSTEKGSATVEATMVIPIFFLFATCLLFGGRSIIANQQMFQVVQESALELAKEYYLCDYIFGEQEPAGTIWLFTTSNAVGRIQQKLEKQDILSSMVRGSISLIGSEITSNQEIHLIVTYQIKLPFNFFGCKTVKKQTEVIQKAYTGWDAKKQKESYVYITETGTVYHSRRSCSHLALSIQEIPGLLLESVYKNLTPCEYCTKKKTGYVYVTNEGDCFHYDIGCRGLKRSVLRVPKSAIGGMRGCERCTGN